MLLSYPGLTGPAELALSDARGLREAGHTVLFGCDTRRDLKKIERSVCADGTQDFGDTASAVDPLAHQDFARAIDAAGFERMAELTLCKSKPTPLELARDVWSLRRRMEGADIVHTRFSHELLVALAAAKLSRRPPRVVHSVEKPPTKGGLWALRAADALVLPSRHALERLVQVQGSGTALREERLHVLPGRVDGARFTPGDGSALRAELNLPSDALVFGIVSRIKIERRHELFLRAFAQVSTALPNARLCVVGRGEHRPAIEALVDELGLRERAVFSGYRAGDELVTAYRALDAQVWLVQGNDGTSRAVLEALACGTPVIAGSGGAQAEVVRDGLDGRVVPLDPAWTPGMASSREELDALARALLDLADRDRREAMRQSARQRAQAFSPAARAEGLRRIYEGLSPVEAG
ncbi:MAG: glycosyltransferase [Myxococcales bacterium]|jgi:glycosyltransferase involved in cell wall biosynthesis|nr:glycosyltransferase [Myxococcales bacterium]